MSDQKKKTYSKVKEFLNQPEQKEKMEKNLDMVVNLIPSGAIKAVGTAAAKRAESIAAKIASKIPKNTEKVATETIEQVASKKPIVEKQLWEYVVKGPTGNVYKTGTSTKDLSTFKNRSNLQNKLETKYNSSEGPGINIEFKKLK